MFTQGDDDLNTFCQPDRTNRDKNDLTSDMTWLTTAEDKSTWDAVKSNCMNGRLKRPARPPTSTKTATTTKPTTHEQTTYTTNAPDQNEDDTKDDHDTLLILSQSIN